MPVVKLPDGSVAIVCGRGLKACEFCGRIGADKLCDAPIAKRRTCDRRMCSNCATSMGYNIDYCPEHVVKPKPAA